MIIDERLATFINSLDVGNAPYLNELERYAKKTNVPIIRTEMQSLLKFLLAMKEPKEILEVGTAIGFSALLMSEYGPKDCHITTIEKYEKRIPLAKEKQIDKIKVTTVATVFADAIRRIYADQSVSTLFD